MGDITERIQSADTRQLNQLTTVEHRYSESSMCGRYVRKSAQEILAEWFEMDLEQMRWGQPTWDAAPQSFQPVVRLNPETGRREMPLMRWGLIPSWAKDERIGLSTISARAEEAATKPAFLDALKKRRCLVPADAYYEWQKTGPKTRQPYAITLTGGEPIVFAGLWESWRDTDGQPLETFTILTTTANERLAAIHNRMPVIVERKDYARWLDAPSASEPSAELLRAATPDRIDLWPVSDRVGNTRNNDDVLLDPINTTGEGTQGQLFKLDS
jgi:putative SOS response-associated peptidase YedK